MPIKYSRANHITAFSLRCQLAKWDFVKTQEVDFCIVVRPWLSGDYYKLIYIYIDTCNGSALEIFGSALQ